MYVIIVGGGRTGQAFAELAIADNHQVVMIEERSDRAQELSATFDCLVLHADAASREILEEAGLQKADAVVATTRNDSVNLMVSLLASQQDVEWVVTIMEDESHTDLFHEIGVHTVESPQRLTGRHLYQRIRRPKVRDFMELSDRVEVMEVEVTEQAEVLGQPLADLVERGLVDENTIFVAILRDDEIIVPKGGTELQVGDVVTLLTETDSGSNITGFF
jgi:trk system potassium uptake protein TrkA